MTLDTSGVATAAPIAIARRGPLWLAGWLLPLAAVLVALLISSTSLQSKLTTAMALVLLATVVVAAVTDIRRRKIYNWLTYPAVVWAIGLNAAATCLSPGDELPAFAFAEAMHVGPAWLGTVGLWQSLSGAATCFGILIVAFTLAGGGAGDVKMATVCGACLGMREGVLALAFCYLAAGAASLAWAVWKRGPLLILGAFARKIGWLLLPGRFPPPDMEQTLLLEKPIPLGPFFALGSLLALAGVSP